MIQLKTKIINVFVINQVLLLCSYTFHISKMVFNLINHKANCLLILPNTWTTRVLTKLPLPCDRNRVMTRMLVMTDLCRNYFALYMAVLSIDVALFVAYCIGYICSCLYIAFWILLLYVNHTLYISNSCCLCTVCGSCRTECCFCCLYIYLVHIFQISSVAVFTMAHTLHNLSLACFELQEQRNRGKACPSSAWPNLDK